MGTRRSGPYFTGTQIPNSQAGCKMQRQPWLPGAVLRVVTAIQADDQAYGQAVSSLINGCWARRTPRQLNSASTCPSRCARKSPFGTKVVRSEERRVGKGGG